MWYVHGNKQKNYCLGAKKFMDNNIFSGNGEKNCSLVVITIIFLCLDVKLYSHHIYIKNHM